MQQKLLLIQTTCFAQQADVVVNLHRGRSTPYRDLAQLSQGNQREGERDYRQSPGADQSP